MYLCCLFSILHFHSSQSHINTDYGIISHLNRSSFPLASEECLDDAHDSIRCHVGLNLPHPLTFFYYRSHQSHPIPTIPCLQQKILVCCSEQKGSVGSWAPHFEPGNGDINRKPSATRTSWSHCRTAFLCLFPPKTTSQTAKPRNERRSLGGLGLDAIRSSDWAGICKCSSPK